MTGGASSIYGANAVSGVVNYVLNDSFEGIDLRGNFSQPTRGDGEAYYTALTAGTNFQDDRGNITFSLEYNRQTEVLLGDRSGSRQSSQVVPNDATIWDALGIDPRFSNVVIDNATFTAVTNSPLISLFGSTLATRSIILGGSPTIGGVPVEQIPDPETGQIRPRELGPFVSGVTTQGGDGANAALSNPASQSIPNFERFNASILANYEITPAM